MAANGTTATDPLSKATRLAKRNLLAVSVAAVVYRAFDISADAWSIPGLPTKLNPRALELLAALTILYFLICFLVYYYIDIKDYSLPSHQDQAEEKAAHLRSLVLQEFMSECEMHFRGKDFGTGGFHLEAAFGSELYRWADNWPSFVGFTWRRWRHPIDVGSAVTIIIYEDKRGVPHWTVDPNPTKDALRVKRQLENHLRRRLRAIPFLYFWSDVRLLHRLYLVRLIYSLRVCGIDFILPVLLGVMAVLALYNVLDVHWLATFAP